LITRRVLMKGFRVASYISSSVNLRLSRPACRIGGLG
jgi:hypothetical protein